MWPVGSMIRLAGGSSGGPPGQRGACAGVPLNVSRRSERCIPNEAVSPTAGWRGRRRREARRMAYAILLVAWMKTCSR